MRRLTDSPFWLILAVAAYILIPLDLIPDFIRPLGFLDDMLILGLGVWHLLRMARRPKRETQQSHSHDTSPSSQAMTTKTPYEVLGISRGATDAEIEHAYKEQIKEYHPDRVHGLGKEIRDVAERKTQELNLAYETLKKESR